MISEAEELSLYLLRMSLENNDLIKYQPSLLATASIYSAISLLKKSPIHGQMINE